jgi:hypothetical protein
MRSPLPSLAGISAVVASLDVERIATHGLPTIARPMRAYYLLSEVAVASRPSTRAACPALVLALQSGSGLWHDLLREFFSESVLGSSPDC